MLPTYIEFIKDHSQENKDYIYLLPAADGKLMISIMKSFDGFDLPIVIKDNAMQEFLSISELSIVTSGTASLESAILECPTIICYKTNFINYSIISRMLKGIILDYQICFWVKVILLSYCKIILQKRILTKPSKRHFRLSRAPKISQTY